MNICIKKYKVFIISLCLVSMFSFNFCQLRVNAVIGADDAVVAEGGILTTAAVSFAVGTLLVSGGAYIYENVDSTDIKYIADGMIQSGEAAKAFSVKTLATGEKVLTWTKDGLDYIANTLTGYHTHVFVNGDGSYSCPFVSDNNSAGLVTVIGSVTIPPHSSWTITGSDWSNTFSRSASDTPTTYVIKSNQWFTGGLSVYAYDSTGSTSVRNLHTFTMNGDYTFNSNLSINGDISHLSTDYNPTTAQDVLCSDVTASDGSICYQPKVGFPLTDSGSTTADGGTIYAPTAGIPYGQTWGDVGTVSIPTNSNPSIPGTGTDTGNPAIPGDTTGNPAIPGDTTGTIDTGKGILDIPILGDILKVLQKILDFLGTLIGSLVTALINALEQLLTKLFVPTADMFNDFYSDIEDNVKSKFPYSVSILNSLKVNADEFKDIHVTIWGHDCVIVSAQFVNDNISWIRVVTSCFWIFSLFVYIWRKINAVLNGGDVNSTTVYAPGSGGSGPPSII